MTQEKNSHSKTTLRSMLFDKGIWLFVALIFMSISYWKKTQEFSGYHSFTEFSLDTVGKDTKRDMRINLILRELIYENEADRAYLIQFHNGEKLAGGQPFRKMSCAYEVAKPGISRELTNLQNIPLSSIANCLKHIIDNDHSFFLETEKVECGPSHALLELQGIKITIRRKIVVKDKLLGFIALNYVISDYLDNQETFSERIKQILKNVDNAAGLLQLEFEKDK